MYPLEGREKGAGIRERGEETARFSKTSLHGSDLNPASLFEGEHEDFSDGA